MADKQPNKAGKADKAKRRVVKNPETFRERAVKASETSDKPKRGARLKTAGGKVAKPAGRASRKLFDYPPFKWLKKPLKLVGRIIFPVWLRDSWHELTLVTWPTWKQSLKLTYAVIIFAVIFGVAIAIVDWVLNKIFKALILG